MTKRHWFYTVLIMLILFAGVGAVVLLIPEPDHDLYVKSMRGDYSAFYGIDHDKAEPLKIGQRLAEKSRVIVVDPDALLTLVDASGHRYLVCSANSPYDVSAFKNSSGLVDRITLDRRMPETTPVSATARSADALWPFRNLRSGMNQILKGNAMELEWDEAITLTRLTIRRNGGGAQVVDERDLSGHEYIVPASTFQRGIYVLSFEFKRRDGTVERSKTEAQIAVVREIPSGLRFLDFAGFPRLQKWLQCKNMIDSPDWHWFSSLVCRKGDAGWMLTRANQMPSETVDPCWTQSEGESADEL